MEYIIANKSILSSLTPRALKVYNFLTEKANRKTRSSFWRRSKIALACAMSESTLARALRELKKVKLIAVQERYETCGRQRSNEYFLLGETPAAMPSMELTKALHGNNLKVYLYLDKRCGRGSYRIAMTDISGACGIALKTAQKCVSYLKRHTYIYAQTQTRLKFYGDNGTGYNLYSICKSVHTISHRQNRLKHIFCALLTSTMTPTLPSTVTPPRTYSKLKITNKEKIEEISLGDPGTAEPENDGDNKTPAKVNNTTAPHPRPQFRFWESLRKIPALLARCFQRRN